MMNISLYREVNQGGSFTPMFAHFSQNDQPLCGWSRSLIHGLFLTSLNVYGALQEPWKCMCENLAP